MFGKLIVGFDESHNSHDAVALGEVLAHACGSSLHLVDVFYDIPGALPDPLRGEMRERAEHSLREAGRKLPGDLAASKHLLAERSPAKALSDYAERTGADVIVLGSSRRAEPGQVRSGRLARRLVEGAPCAVAIAAEGFRDRAAPLRHIGVGVDGRPESIRALDAAIALARACDASLLLIAAVDAPDPVVGQYGVAAERVVRESLRSAAERALEQAGAGIPADVPFKTRLVVDGAVSACLARTASEAGLDLLVVGSRAFGPIRRVLLGSVSSELMSAAPCALLVVPRGSEPPMPAEATVVETAEAS